MNLELYDEAYYAGNGQDADRPALSWYVRVAKRRLDLTRTCDFGCGTGWLMRHLAAHGEVAGVEPSPVARELAVKRNPGSPVCASLEEFGERSFSCLFAVHVVEHLSDSDLREVFSQFRRTLVPHGTLFLVTPDQGGLADRLMGSRWRAIADPTHINLKPWAAWTALLDKEGFEVLATGTDGLWDWPYSSAGVHWLTGPALVAAQLATGRLIARPGTGESLVVLARRR